MKKNWIIDASLLIIIIVMGVFVVIELNRAFNFMQRDPLPQEEDGLSDQVNGKNPTVIPDSEFESPAEDFDLMSISGDLVSLSDFRGNSVVINFWATWCPPCKAEMPLFDEIASEFQEELRVLAVNSGENEPVIREFSEEFSDHLIFLMDSDNSVGNLYRVSGLPTTFFIDKQGIIRSVHIGELNRTLLLNNLRKIGIEE